MRHFRLIYFRVPARTAVAALSGPNQGSASSVRVLLPLNVFLCRPAVVAAVRGHLPLPRARARPRPNLLWGPPPGKVTSGPSVSGSPLAPGYWFLYLAARRRAESPAGPGSGGGRASRLRPSSGRPRRQSGVSEERPRTEAAPGRRGRPILQGSAGRGTRSPSRRPGRPEGPLFRPPPNPQAALRIPIALGRLAGSRGRPRAARGSSGGTSPFSATSQAGGRLEPTLRP